MILSDHTRKRRLAAITLSVTAALALLPTMATTANAAPGEMGGYDSTLNLTFSYDPDDVAAGATLTYWPGEPGNLDFPERVTDDQTGTSFTLTGIDRSAGFSGRYDRVFIPATISSIAPNAFSQVITTELVLADGITTISDEAFSNSEIGTVELPSTLTTIGKKAFWKSKLSTLTLPTSVITIGDQAFASNRLTSVSVPGSLANIGEAVFFENQINSATFGDGATTIGIRMFEDNELTSLALPNSVTSIGDSAFALNSIASLDLGAGVASIGSTAFVNNKLTEVTLRASLTSMGLLAFAYNEIAQINFAEGLTEVGESVFPGNRLSSLELPSTVTTIGQGAFANNQFTELTLPNQVTTIGSGAFMENQLTKVTLGNKVDTIDEFAFGDNPDLSRVIFTGPTPSNIFRGDSDEASLGNSLGLVVLYQPQFGQNSTPGGFTSPRWQGYYTFPVSATVTFVTNGGNTIENKIVSFGELLALPTAPVKAGNAFTGWFTNKELTTEFYANDMINADLTLYAGWKADGSVKPNPGGPGGPGTKPGTTGGLPNTGGSNAELMAAVAAAGVLLAAGATVLARRKFATKQ